MLHTTTFTTILGFTNNDRPMRNDLGKNYVFITGYDEK